MISIGKEKTGLTLTSDQKSRLGKSAAWFSIGLNFLLFVVKAVMGFLTGSLALIADAFHTLSDIGTSLVVLFAFRISAKPSDAEHPFGHGRAEYISAIVMSTILAVTGLELGKSAISRILHPTSFDAPLWVIGVLILSIVLKEAMAVYSRRISRRIDSTSLEADAWHHHQDAISTLLVIASFLFTRINFPYLDGPIGLLIAGYILYTAYVIAKTPIDHLLGTAPDESVVSRLEEITLAFPGVRGIHDIIVHHYGDQLIISLHIEVDDDLSLKQAHHISEQVNQLLRDELNAYVTIHVDPVMERTPFYRTVEAKIREFCHQNPACFGFHDLRLFGEETGLDIAFDLVIAADAKSGEEEKLIKQCQQYLRGQFPTLRRISIKVEPKFSISRRSRHDVS